MALAWQWMVECFDACTKSWPCPDEVIVIPFDNSTDVDVTIFAVSQSVSEMEERRHDE